MAVYTDSSPSWLQWIAPEKFNDSELFRIVAFFVFHSPCSGLSSMGRSLEEYGWNTPWQKPFCLKKQLLDASTNENLLFSACSYDAMEDALQKADLLNDFPFDFYRERVCVYDNQKNQSLSVFYHIRNAFAHGRLNMIDFDGECIFVLEDVKHQKGQTKLKVSARMILRKKTLLRWIDIVEGGEREWTPCNQHLNKTKR